VRLAGARLAAARLIATQYRDAILPLRGASWT
jgi:hypothetical protein